MSETDPNPENPIVIIFYFDGEHTLTYPDRKSMLQDRKLALNEIRGINQIHIDLQSDAQQDRVMYLEAKIDAIDSYS